MADKNEGNRREESGKQRFLFKTRISKVKFPEMCPVCLGEPEDLVSVTIVERSKHDRAVRSSAFAWASKGRENISLVAASGAATFWVPTCMRHGTRGLRSDRMKLVPVITFFLLFYPALYFVLRLISALQGGTETLTPAIGLTATASTIVVTMLYGFLPRALERTLRFIDINKGQDTVFLEITNEQYAQAFLELNRMFVDVLSGDRANAETDKHLSE
ncbi:MAG: hypothetical protein HXY34_08680 [Candidatus Thorarchaeota archaeon]|nr:hypothetical protein [Candidatus Thorarchaeota archaeon]